MTTPATLHDELKQTTSKPHQALEKKMVKVIKGIKTQGDYARFLELMYGYYAALEKDLDRYLPYMQLGHRRTANKLLSDINQVQTADRPAGRVELCRDLPAIDSLASALGAMYVVEGSVMGAPQIAKMIASQLKLSDNTSLTFFNGSAEDVSSNWSIFLSNFSRDFEDDERQSIIRAATATFEAFSHWIDERS